MLSVAAHLLSLAVVIWAGAVLFRAVSRGGWGNWLYTLVPLLVALLIFGLRP